VAVHGPMSIDRRPIFAQPASKRLEVLSNFGPGKAGWWEQSRADWTCPPTSECPLGGHIRGPIAPLSGLSRGWARTFGGGAFAPQPTHPRSIRGPGGPLRGTLGRLFGRRKCGRRSQSGPLGRPSIWPFSRLICPFRSLFFWLSDRAIIASPSSRGAPIGLSFPCR